MIGFRTPYLDKRQRQRAHNAKSKLALNLGCNNKDCSVCGPFWRAILWIEAALAR